MTRLKNVAETPAWSTLPGLITVGSGVPSALQDHDELDTLAGALTAAAGAATDRIAAAVRGLRAADAPGDDVLTTMTSDVRALHTAIEHLRSLHPEADASSRPAPALLDAVDIARDVAEDFEAEKLHVRIESAIDRATFPGNAPDIRRILRWLVERAAESDVSPWVQLRVSVSAGCVVYELPWSGGDLSDTARTEREWLQRLVREQAGTLVLRGLRARVSFPQESGASALLRDPDALAQEIVGLREQRAAQAREAAHVAAQLRAAQAELDLVRAHGSRLQDLIAGSALDLQRVLEPLGGAAAAIAEHDALGPEVQSSVQSALDRVLLMLHQAGLSPNETTAESRVGPRMTSDEPDAMGALQRALEPEASVAPGRASAAAPPEATEGLDEPGEADIPLSPRQ